MHIIKTKALTKRYGKARGIEDVNLEVQEGEFYGFIGPNGAGKSTTIRTLLGLMKPTSGEIYIYDKIMPGDKIEILKKIGYVPSESVFYDMKVRDILSLSNRLRGIDSDKESDKLCKIFELDVTKKASQLSFGNKKKVNIVSALAHNPQLYILDEPTTGLDPLVQRTFFEILHERQKNGATVLLSSHVLSEVQTYCRSASIIKDGKLIASGTIDSLIKGKIKKVEVHTSDNIADVDGISNLVRTDNKATFLFNGEIEKLIHMLGKIAVKDIIINEPTLEETFIHFYERKEI